MYKSSEPLSKNLLKDKANSSKSSFLVALSDGKVVLPAAPLTFSVLNVNILTKKSSLTTNCLSTERKN